MTLLSVRDLVVRFGGVVALNGATFEVDAGQICGLIGPNGAGKSTLFDCLSRLRMPESGTVTFDGRDLLRRKPHQVSGLGIARTFQNLGLSPSLSVRSNVLLGAHPRCRGSFAAAGLGLPRARRIERTIAAEADGLIERLGLASVADHPAEGLPYGTLKRVELARALLDKPRMLLLDEPAGGLSSEDVHDLGSTLLELRDELGLTVLLVEHAMSMVMRVSDHVVVLNFGQKIADGPPASVRTHPEVVEAYLGEAA